MLASKKACLLVNRDDELLNFVLSTHLYIIIDQSQLIKESSSPKFSLHYQYMPKRYFTNFNSISVFILKHYYSSTMGKKIQKQQANSNKPEEKLPPKTKQLQKYLPHHKYVIKRSKNLNSKKQQCLSTIKLNKHQILSAVTCLKQFVSKSHNVKDLFHGNNQAFIYLEIDLSEVPEQYSIRPIQISLPVPIYSQKYNSRCAIFTTDPESDFTSKIDGLNLPMVSEAIGYERAKKHFRNNKEKLKLFNANDMFFCDWKIYNLLRKPLGKLFYQKKRYPFPIDCEQVPEYLKQKHKSYEQYLNSLMSYTYTMLGNGPVYTLKVGRFDMSNPDLVKNIMRGAYRFLPYVLENVDVKKVRQISIKGYNSPSLPIYNFLSKEQVANYQKHKKVVLQKSQPKPQAKSQVKQVK